LVVHSVGPSLSIADVLFSKVRQRVLGILFGNPGKTFYATEIIALAGSGHGAVQRELAKLERAGIVIAHKVGRQIHYRINTAPPVIKTLRALVLQTSGLADVLTAVLAPVADRIDAAFVYGSVAKRSDTVTSDVDLMIVSDSLAYADIFALLEKASQRLGRRVNPTIYSHSELAKRVKQRKSFTKRVLSQPKIWLIGGPSVISAR
jgi:predicted nucleotidyltransferase